MDSNRGYIIFVVYERGNSSDEGDSRSQWSKGRQDHVYGCSKGTQHQADACGCKKMKNEEKIKNGEQER